MNNSSPDVIPGTTYEACVKMNQDGEAGDCDSIYQETISGPVAPGSGMATQREIALNESATLFPNPNMGIEGRHP